MVPRKIVDLRNLAVEEVSSVALVLATLASAFSATTAVATAASAAASAGAEVGGIVLVLAIIPLGVVLHSVAWRATLQVWAFLDVGEHVLTAIIWGDESEPLVLDWVCPEGVLQGFLRRGIKVMPAIWSGAKLETEFLDRKTAIRFAHDMKS